ncbi:MAG: tetratricopeptide repeat protein [Chitinophagaceae bacterium]|nr:MAG: tetratricopeptide repeat protein [Chitinophagaceae bacterium]
MKCTVHLLFLFLLWRCPTVAGQSVYVDSLLRIVAMEKRDDASLKALLQLAIECHRADPGKGKAYLHKLVNMSIAAANYDRECAAYSLLLSIYQEEGHTDSSLYCLDGLRSVAQKAPASNKVQTNYNQAMGRYYAKKGDHKTALPFALAAVRLAEEGNIDKSHIAGQWLNAGDVYESLADYNNAMVCNLKALHFFEGAGNKLGESFCYNNIAAVYINLRQYGKALSYARKSLDLKKELGDQRSICTSLESLGNIYIGLDSLQQALSSYRQALAISMTQKMPIEEATCYFSMAKIFSALRNDSLAIVYYLKTKSLAERLGNELIAANAEMELAGLLTGRNVAHETESNLVASLRVFQNTGNLENEAANYKRLSEFYARNKKYDKALNFSTKYHAIKDSIAGAGIQLQLNTLEEKYNSDKKEKEIQLLKKDQELQKQTLFRQRSMSVATAILLALAVLGIALLVNRNRLRQRMKELELRNQIAADLHDEVGSSLSSIHILSQMASVAASEPARQDILARMNNNALETMDKMGDIVWMIKPGENDSGGLRQRMKRLADEMAGLKGVDCIVELDELENLRLTWAQRKNIYLVFKEAIHNALKYSGATSINVMASVQAGSLTMKITDNGRGFDPVTVRHGNGLENMQKRATELKGKLSIMSAPGAGTVVEFVIPA